MQSKSLAHNISLALIVQSLLQTSVFCTFAPTEAAFAITPVKDTAGKNDENTDAPKRDYTAPVLANLAREYKQSPDDLSWGKYLTYLRDLLLSPDFASANPADLIAANPSLSDMHVKVIDVGVKNIHIWSFPSINESHAVIFAAPGKTVFIPLPQSVVLREARVIPSAITPSSTAPASASRGKVPARGAGKSAAPRGKALFKRPAAPAAALPNLAAFGRFLVLIGGDRQTNMVWLKGFKFTEGPLVESPELFASLPMYFTQNVSGRATFSGSDIVLTIQTPTSNTPRDSDDKSDVIIQANGKPLVTKPVASAVAGYKVILKYMGGKFGLSGKLPDDAPLSIALSFAQNICANHPDVAKAWLIDAKLISIPKYLGLIGRSSPPMRLVAMSGGSGSRYRLITSAKDDMIIEVGRVITPGKLKGQLAVKALFVAPPDPYAAKFTGILVTPQAPAPDKEDDDAATGGGAKTNPAR